MRYLLNPAHPTGGSKARFFLRFGFHAAAWGKRAETLLRLAREYDFVETAQTPFGARYVIESALVAPSGAALNICTACFPTEVKTSRTL